MDVLARGPYQALCSLLGCRRTHSSRRLLRRSALDCLEMPISFTRRKLVVARSQYHYNDDWTFLPRIRSVLRGFEMGHPSRGNRFPRQVRTGYITYDLLSMGTLVRPLSNIHRGRVFHHAGSPSRYRPGNTEMGSVHTAYHLRNARPQNHRRERYRGVDSAWWSWSMADCLTSIATNNGCPQAMCGMGGTYRVSPEQVPSSTDKRPSVRIDLLTKKVNFGSEDTTWRPYQTTHLHEPIRVDRKVKKKSKDSKFWRCVLRLQHIGQQPTKSPITNSIPTCACGGFFAGRAAASYTWPPTPVLITNFSFCIQFHLARTHDSTANQFRF